jgi:RNA polymerase sigma-70 factor (ECF subfamily)
MKVETEIITACINRDERAEEELYKRSYSFLMSICLRYCNNREEAREMINLGFYRILTNLTKYKLETSFQAWMGRVMVNVLIDEYRKKKKQWQRMQYVESYDEVEEDTEVNGAVQKMDVEQIHALISKLPPVSQKVFNMYAIDGFSHKEIAESLGISEGTSRWHLNFSRQKLQEMILKVNASLNLLVG